MVEPLGRNIIERAADVRDATALQRVVSESRREFDAIDIVVANASIAVVGSAGKSPNAFRDTIDVNLVGVWNTVMAAALITCEAGNGGAIVLICSTQGLKGVGGYGTAGITAYTAAKHGVVGLMRSFAH